MQWSKAFISTQKEAPADAEATSHQLMVRAGLIRKLAAGTYIYLPIGLKVLNKVVAIIREEMNRAGAQELLMPVLQPAALWQESGRLAAFGELIYRVTDRTGKLSLLGPTHEEIITHLVRNEISSYRQLPVTLYQIQTKFRDELRPRFGIIRSKEFLMKDAYSFDINLPGLDKSYQAMYDAYCRIFDRCGLKYRAVEAETGLMGGDVSHEFMVPASFGEDSFINCTNTKCSYGANITMATAGQPQTTSAKSKTLEAIKPVSTPRLTSIEEVSNFLKVKPEQLVKTLICLVDKEPVVVLIRGDHELNMTKMARLFGTDKISLADQDTVERVTNSPMGFSGPVGLKNIKLIADHAVESLTNFVVGANQADTHLINANLNRDFKVTQFADVRLLKEDEPCPRCGTPLKISTGIEVGHVFKLGTKYSKLLGALFLDEKGERQPVVMGCYGIGAGRIIAALIENSHDTNGIIWSKELAPYHIIITAINPKDKSIIKIAQQLYNDLQAKQIEVLWDDRDLSAGVKFKDADLLGIPLRITVGKKTIKEKTVDIRMRFSGIQKSVPLNKAIKEALKMLEVL